ncbi:MAG: hypothetical protein ACKVZJ_01725 [Phycisphaerales bacterium]
MSALPEPILVINDGSLPALVASLMARDLERVTAWIPPSGSSLRGLGADEASQASLVNQQSDLLAYERVIAASALQRPVPERWIEQPQSLLSAMNVARALGCLRVIWPIVAGDRLSEMLEFAERAALINRLSWLGESERASTAERAVPAAVSGHATVGHGTVHGGGTGAGVPSHAFRLETPFIDLTTAQVAEIARDLDAPLQACWWTELAGV